MKCQTNQRLTKLGLQATITTVHIQVHVTVLYLLLLLFFKVLLVTPQKVHNITLTILCNTLLNHSRQLYMKIKEITEGINLGFWETTHLPLP